MNNYVVTTTPKANTLGAVSGWESFLQNLSQAGGSFVESGLRSTEFGKVLDAVEEKATEAVVKETKKNAVLLITLALAGGAVGGSIFKGRNGLIVASLLTAVAATPLLLGTDLGKK